MTDVPTFEVVVERHNRRSSVESIADTREGALLDALRAYAAVYEQTVGGVEIRHNDSHYSVLGIVEEDTDGELYVDEHDREGILNAGGISVRVTR